MIVNLRIVNQGIFYLRDKIMYELLTIIVINLIIVNPQIVILEIVISYFFLRILKLILTELIKKNKHRITSDIVNNRNKINLRVVNLRIFKNMFNMFSSRILKNILSAL